MTDERLEELRQLFHRQQYLADGAGELLAEIDRLRAKLATKQGPARLKVHWKGPLSSWLRNGPSLVRTHDVLRVELTDREPFEWDKVFFWEEAKLIPDRPSLLPTALWQFMGHGQMPDDMPPGTRGVFDRDRQAALDALSEACLAWARQEGPS